MNRMIKSYYSLTRCLGLVLIFGFIAIGAIGGCSNNNGGGPRGYVSGASGRRGSG